MKRAVGSQSVETVVCKSKFLAENFSVDNPAQVMEIVRRQKERYPGATHVCHAFLCGPQREFAGCSDDREPSGTAGRPMLEVLKGSDLTDILVTVVRWFGGTKLGTGGLARAYSDAVKELLPLLKTEEAAEKATVTFEASYSDYEKIRRFAEKNGGEWQKENFGGTVVCSVVVPLAKAGEFRSGISELTAARVRFLENN